MHIPLRSCLTAGVATITAAAIAFGPAVQEQAPTAPPPAVVHLVSPPVRLAAQVQPLAAQVQPLAAANLPNLLVGWLQRIVVPPSAGQPFPTPPSGVSPAPTSIPSTLEWAYHAVEPWVRYGFEVATYAVGWIPYVGWLSGQIMIFYNFGERIVHAIAHNTLDWLSGNGNFWQNVADGVAWTIDAFIQLGIDEWNYFLPPLPPLPPFPFSAAQVTTTPENLTSLAASDTTQVNEKHSAIKDEEVADVPDDATVKVDKGPKGDVVNEPKGPREPKAPKVTTDVTAQDDETTTTNDAPKKGPDSEKKTDKGSTEKAATKSSSSATDKKSDAGKKSDTGKTGDTGKKSDNKKGDKE